MTDGQEYATSVSGLSQEELNGLYIIKDTTNASNQWLASPSSIGKSYMMSMTSNGYVFYSDTGNTIVGVRPVVCLKSDVVITADGDGYKIQ